MVTRTKDSNRSRYSAYRFLVQTAAFLVILLNPFANYYLGVNFVQGWYQSLGIGKLWFVSPLEGIESILVSKLIYLPLLIGMAIPVLLALFLGRVFCGWICPINYLSEIIDRFRRFLSRKRFIKDWFVLPKYLLWFALIGELVLTMVLGAPIFVWLSPPGLVGREIMMAVFFRTLAVEGVVVLMVLTMNLVTRRFYCRYLCPLGGLLAFLGSRRKLVVARKEPVCKECGMCSKVCPLGLDPLNGESRASYCWNCGECVDICPDRTLGFAWRTRPMEDFILHQAQNDSRPRDESE